MKSVDPGENRKKGIYWLTYRFVDAGEMSCVVVADFAKSLPNPVAFQKSRAVVHVGRKTIGATLRKISDFSLSDPIFCDPTGVSASTLDFKWGLLHLHDKKLFPRQSCQLIFSLHFNHN